MSDAWQNGAIETMRERAKAFRWRTTDARNITTEEGWVAIPREDYDTLKALLALIAEAEGEPRGWRPIETAPKDGTPILAYPVWSNWKVAEVVWHEMVRTPGRWESRGLAVRCEPTHWMPLPTPPAGRSP